MTTLKLQERVHLTGILPNQGKFEDLILIKSVNDKIKITAKEVEECEIKSAGTALTWNAKGVDSVLSVEFSEGETKIISELLKKMSAEEKLPMDLIGLYEQITK